MTIYLAFLRGVNVGGHRKIPMAKLSAMMTSMGFHHVRTYIQSGNIVFAAGDEHHSAIELKISGRIQAVFGFEVPVIIRTEEAIRHIISCNPFIANTASGTENLFLCLLKSPPDQENLHKLSEKAFAGEQLIAVDDHLFLKIDGSYGKAKLNNNYIEGKLKMDATTRNWKTMMAMISLAESIRP